MDGGKALFRLIGVEESETIHTPGGRGSAGDLRRRPGYPRSHPLYCYYDILNLSSPDRRDPKEAIHPPPPEGEAGDIPLLIREIQRKPSVPPPLEGEAGDIPLLIREIQRVPSVYLPPEGGDRINTSPFWREIHEKGRASYEVFL